MTDFSSGHNGHLFAPPPWPLSNNHGDPFSQTEDDQGPHFIGRYQETKILRQEVYTSLFSNCPLYPLSFPVLHQNTNFLQISISAPTAFSLSM